MKKGFTLVETIVMILFLTISLLMIYSSFTNSLENEKIRRKFDNTIYIYRTYYMLEYLSDSGLNTYLTPSSLTNSNKEITCNLTNLTNKSHCTFLVDKFNIEKMFLMPYEIPSTIDYNNLLPSLTDYVKTLNYKGNGYRLVIKFKDDNYASLKVNYE